MAALLGGVKLKKAVTKDASAPKIESTLFISIVMPLPPEESLPESVRVRVRRGEACRRRRRRRWSSHGWIVCRRLPQAQVARRLMNALHKKKYCEIAKWRAEESTVAFLKARKMPVDAN